MKIGILGGTFNPAHFGHLLLAEGVKASLSLDKIVFVPANLPPHKKNTDIADARLRLKMVKLAVSGNPDFLVSDIEIRKKGVSFTIDTLKALKKKFARHDELFFIIGSDELKYLDSWRDICLIRKIVKFVVASRPGCDLSDMASGIIRADVKTLDISGYAIRERIRNNKSIRYLLPDTVEKFITRIGLYRK